MKRVTITFIDETEAEFKKVINSDELLTSLNNQRKFFEVLDEDEGTYIYKASDVDFISIK